MMSLGARISNKRKVLKLSQEYVAEQLGVSRQAVSKWETDKSEPSMDNFIKLADLLDSDIKELVSPEQYVEEQKDVDSRLETSQKDIKMQMAAFFGRIFMLVSFVGFMGVDKNDFALMPNWFPYTWWGGLFLIGVALTFIGSRDYFNRKSGPRKIIWFDLLSAFSFFFYQMLPFGENIIALIILLFNIVIVSIINIKFFIPVWRKPLLAGKVNESKL